MLGCHRSTQPGGSGGLLLFPSFHELAPIFEVFDSSVNSLVIIIRGIYYCFYIQYFVFLLTVQLIVNVRSL